MPKPRFKQIQPPGTTGGVGFQFEDAVGAWYLVHMLVDRRPFGHWNGVISRAKFQVSIDGWPLDDMLLEMNSPSTTRAMVTIKSNRSHVISQRGFSTDFVKACWNANLECSEVGFDSAVDLAVIATSQVPDALREAVHEVVNRATGDPDALRERALKRSRWLNKLQRTLIASFACPFDPPTAKASRDVG